MMGAFSSPECKKVSLHNFNSQKVSSLLQIFQAKLSVMRVKEEQVSKNLRIK